MPIVTPLVRLFVSSTFEDLRRERDLLPREVFPELSRLCEARGARFQAVDLRWGISPEAGREQRTMAICLSEIERCQQTGLQPSFVILLGERYGWCPLPAAIPASEFELLLAYVVADEDRKLLGEWYRRDRRDDNACPAELVLKPKAGKERWSEVEARLRAVLKAAAQAAGLPPSEALKYGASSTHQEISKGLQVLPEDRETIFAFCRKQGTSAEAPELRDLKVWLREQLGDRVIEYDGNELSELGRVMVSRLGAVIESRLTRLTTPAGLDLELTAQEAFARERAQHFQGREDLLQALANYLESEERRPLLLEGEAGSGKSALMARASTLAQETHPEALVVRRFVAASPESSDGPALLRGVHQQIARDRNSDEKGSAVYHELLRELAEALRRTPPERPLFLFIDGLDQLPVGDPARSLSWIPSELPPHCKMVVSAIAGSVPFRGTLYITVGPLSLEDAGIVLADWLKGAGRTLQPEQTAKVLEAFQRCVLPLFLRLAFEEARSWRSFDPLEECSLGSDLDEIVDHLFARLSEEAQHGSVLLEHSLSYLTASRHGVTEDEMLALLSLDDAVWEDFNRRSFHHPPERRLPHIVWSRLYADLEPYLTARQTPDGLLIGFFHRRLAERFATTWMSADARRRTHVHLACYFRTLADPEGDGSWIGRGVRGRRELLFHLALGGEEKAAEALLTSLAYLHARSGGEEIAGLLADYPLITPTPASAAWRAFLQRHAQQLSQRPNLLVALAHHEQFQPAQSQEPGLRLLHPWIRSWPEPRPHVPGSSIGSRCELEAAWHSPRGEVKALAATQRLVFRLERLGVIGLVDLLDLHELADRLTVRRERPLRLCCSPDGSSLLVFFESGMVHLYRCTLDDEARPVAATLAGQFSYFLPEIDDPVVVWREGGFLFQTGAATLGCLDVASGLLTEESLPDGGNGELAALLDLATGTRLVALRQAGGVLLLGDGGRMLRRGRVDLCTACACGEHAALVFSDGWLIVYSVTETIAVFATLEVGVVRGALGWDGERLLWFQEEEGFRYWRPGDPKSTRLLDEEAIFPSDLHIIPSLWAKDGEGTTLLLSSHSVVVFRIGSGGTASPSRVERLFGGPVWRAVRMWEKAQWLWEGQPCREVELGVDVSGRLYGAPDGRGLFYAVRVEGYGQVWKLATLETWPVRNAPMALNSAVGDPESGCWFADRTGYLYYVGPDGHCRQVASVNDLDNPHGAVLHACGEYLVWRGYAEHWYPGVGMEQARTFVFFRRSLDPTPQLERLGVRRFAVREGLCLALDYAPKARFLIALWHLESGGEVLRMASVEDFLAGRFRDCALRGVGPLAHPQMAVCPEETMVGVVNQRGELICLDLRDGSCLATLEGSSSFTHIAPGGGGEELWLVAARDRIFGCSLVRPL